MSRGNKVLLAVLAAFCILGVAQATSEKSAVSPSTTTQPAGNPSAPHPNILFVIMDDVGIDQMSSFGYGGPVPPKMPVIDTIAYQGIRFRNSWSMPECSPARAAFFTGRWPLRNNIFQAIGPKDLNNSQVATWEVTVPELLAAAHYAATVSRIDSRRALWLSSPLLVTVLWFEALSSHTQYHLTVSSRSAAMAFAIILSAIVLSMQQRPSLRDLRIHIGMMTAKLRRPRANRLR